MHELPQRQAERLDVVPGGFVAQRYAHGAGLAVQAVVEPKRPDASPDVSLVGFQQRDRMAAAFELVGGAQAGKPGADDDHVERLAAIGDRSENATATTWTQPRTAR